MLPSKHYLPAIYRIIESMPLRMFINIREATVKEDTQHATDLVIEFHGGDMGLRCREIEYWNRFADFTIRAKCKFNPRTEIHKIRDGWCNWYFYCWVGSEANRIDHWILLDVNKIRASGLLDADRRLIPNGDGAGFFSYSLQELDNALAILSCDMPTDKRRAA